MKTSDNLKKYKLGIVKSLKRDQTINSFIPIIMTIIGCFNFNWKIKATGLILLAIFYYITGIRIGDINTDNKFLDQDIIRLQELFHELEKLKVDNKVNTKKYNKSQVVLLPYIELSLI